MNGARGKVWLVGAGPGSLGLVTARARECLMMADVVLYDDLLNPAMLSWVKPGTKLIPVGKRGCRENISQSAINELIAGHAMMGNDVCRLKGGDPFIFGRGGEEAIHLSKEGIEFEIVPGISSALAAPALAGISVTHRGVSSGVAIFTGHEDPTKEASDLNWEAMAELHCTLVFLMGMKNIEFISSRLIGSGMSPDIPCAVIHRGTTPFQQTIVGTIGDIAELVQKSGLGAPAVIVIGEAVRLRESLSWFEGRPLFGKRILITRTRQQASVLAEKLDALGAAAIEYPTIAIEENPDGKRELERALIKIDRFDWIIFCSANGVEIFMRCLRRSGFDSRRLSPVKIAAIGPATRDALTKYGIDADLMPDRYVAEGLLEALGGDIAGKSFLIPSTDLARDVLPDGLRRNGAKVEVIEIYRTLVASDHPESIADLMEQVDIVTFTSSSTVDNFVKLLGVDFEKYRSSIHAASIGPITSNALRSHNIEVVCEASVYTIDGLVDAILKYGNKNR